MARLIAIDPGKNGAIAVFDDAQLVNVYDMPTHEVDAKTVLDTEAIVKLLSENLQPNATIVVERQQSMPKQGVVSTFTTGMNYGILLGIVAALGHEPQVISPRHWKQSYPSFDGMSRAEQKTQARRIAADRCRNHKVKFQRVKDHDRAEAVLMGLAMQ